MATILPKKAGYEVPTALDDEHYDALASDPSILNVFGSKADEVVKMFCKITSVINSFATGLIDTS